MRSFSSDTFLYGWIAAGVVIIHYPLSAPAPLEFLYPNFQNDVLSLKRDLAFQSRFVSAVSCMFLLFYGAIIFALMTAIVRADLHISGWDAFKRAFGAQAATFPFNAAFLRPSIFEQANYGQSTSSLVLPANDISLYIMHAALAVQIYGFFWLVVFLRSTVTRKHG